MLETIPFPLTTHPTMEPVISFRRSNSVPDDECPDHPERIDVIAFDYDGNGSALIQANDRLDRLDSSTLDDILFGTSETGKHCYETAAGSSHTPGERPDSEPPTRAGNVKYTRVQAMSWTHAEQSQGFVDVMLDDGTSARGLIVGFGEDEPGDTPVQIRRGSIDSNSFQVCIREPDGRGFWYSRYIRPQAIVGVEIESAADRRITTGREVNGPTAPAAAFIVDDETIETLGQDHMHVQLRCDFILDIDGIPVSGQHLAGRLDGVSRSPAHPGGLFESWFERKVEQINLNTATIEELRTLPRVGPSLANRIITAREEMGGFTAVDDLVGVPGIGRSVVEVLRPFVKV